MEKPKKFDMTQSITNIDGSIAMLLTKILPVVLCEDCGQPRMNIEVFTLRDALIRCLTTDEVDPRTGRAVPAKEPDRTNRVRLAIKIMDNDALLFSLKDIVMMKELAEKFLGPVPAVRVKDILEPPTEEDLEDTDGD